MQGSSPFSTRARFLFVLRRVCLLGLVAWPGLAQAVVAENVVLVLRVTQDGRNQEKLTAQVRDFLNLAGAKLAETRLLRATERKCADPDCLVEVAERHDASLLLAASIESHKDRDRLMRLVLFDARSSRDQVATAVVDQTGIEAQLKALAGQLLGPYLEGQEGRPRAAAPELAAASLKSTPPRANAQPVGDAAPRPSKPVRALPRWQRALGITLATAAGVSLVTAVAFTAAEVAVPTNDCVFLANTDCTLRHNQIYGPAYAAAGALSIAAVLTFTLR